MTDTAGTPDLSGMGDWPTGRLLSTAARMVENAWADGLDALGLTHAGLIVLHLLDGGPLSQTQLARGARVETQTMSRTIERLERSGFVAREVDARDRRRQVVSRTASGDAVWGEARTLEARVFPEVQEGGSFRDQLLTIIRSSSRWG